MKTQVMLVSPEMASVWLEENTENRPVRLGWVKELAGMIERDEFKLTHQGIAFSKTGRLLDGQHRLMAIVEADKAVQLQVSSAGDESTFNAIDGGVKRSFADMYRIDNQAAAVSRLLAGIVYARPSPEQQAKMHAIVGPVLEDLRSFCPYTKKGFTSSAVQAAACMRILAGENVEYIKLTYWNVAHVAHSELPPIARAFVDQVYGKMTNTRGGDRYDLLARALKVFDEKSANINRLTISGVSASLDFVRSVLLPLLEPQKKPANKAPALPRAKVSTLSHAKRA